MQSTSNLNGRIQIGYVQVGDEQNPLVGGGVEKDGNQVNGIFRLAFRGVMTGNISAQASANEFKSALESISSLFQNATTVTRSDPSQARGFIWKIRFVHPNLGGNLPSIIVPVSGLTGVGSSIKVGTIQDGNELTV